MGANESGLPAAEDERHLTKAFPLDEVPFASTVEAMRAYYEVRGRAKHGRDGQWRLVGPSVSYVPAALSVLRRRVGRRHHRVGPHHRAADRADLQ